MSRTATSNTQREVRKGSRYINRNMTIYRVNSQLSYFHTLYTHKLQATDRSLLTRSKREEETTSSKLQVRGNQCNPFLHDFNSLIHQTPNQIQHNSPLHTTIDHILCAMCVVCVFIHYMHLRSLHYVHSFKTHEVSLAYNQFDGRIRLYYIPYYFFIHLPLLILLQKIKTSVAVALNFETYSSSSQLVF